VISDASCEHDQSRAPRRLQGTAFWLLGRAARQAERLTQRRLFEVGMRRGFYGVLATLEEFGPGAQAEIGRRLGIDPSDMVAIINDLEREGYVSRERDPEDRRRNSVTITDAGAGALVWFDTAIAAAQDEMLSGLDPGERDQLIGLLERIAAPARPVGPASAGPAPAGSPPPRRGAS
jgi:MarR family transcriptional regulator, lower aerobic nicotinate degradation pathway regulator